MKAELILQPNTAKHNKSKPSLNLELCRYKRLKELVNDSAIFIHRVESGFPLKVFYYA